MQQVTLFQGRLAQVQEEFAAADDSERRWIENHCLRIGALQEQLDLLFRQGDGQQQCRDCRGDCCALGHNHLTLANLLMLLVQAVAVPDLDYSKTCPLLGPQGCILPVKQRPYNCISFLCDRIESQLTADQVELFYRQEAELRRLYRAFTERYAGGSMSGLLLAARRLEGRHYLKRNDNL